MANINANNNAGRTNANLSEQAFQKLNVPANLGKTGATGGATTNQSNSLGWSQSELTQIRDYIDNLNISNLSNKDTFVNELVNVIKNPGMEQGAATGVGQHQTAQMGGKFDKQAICKGIDMVAQKFNVAK